ncbi:MAG: right-handed parallel beta-helix repeat-containing protein [Lewinellaceae bacterium]|nr:right-handed parallel beta-helix repeat-containing protein [Lewinellaceae bacterium]
MKNQLALLTLCLFFSGFSLLAQPLSGDYTIGGPAPDYPTFTDAVDALISNGVDGPVLFTIADGTYSEQISIPEITGASSANTITFLGNGIFTSLLFTGSFSQRAGIELNGADHIILDNIQIHAIDQYGWCIHLHNGADNNTIRNCILVAEGVIQNEDAAIVGSNSTTNTAVAGDVADSLVIENNHLDGGWNAIELYSSGNAYLRINGNTINNFGRWATRIVGFNDFTYNDNDLYSNTDGSVSDHLFGLTALNCANPGRINGNHILLNHLKRISGISLNNTSGTVDDKILIANNAVIIIGETNEVQVRAFALQGTSGQVKFYHNSASINTDPSSRALIMEANNSGGVELVNNIFANFGLGLALDIGDPTDVVLSDHNDFFNLSGELVLWGGNTYTSLTSYQSASGFDVHSLAVNPEFANVESNLHAESLVMDNAGIPVPEVSDDFDGQLRHPATPDMGADEFFFDSLDVVNLQLIQPVTGMSPDGSAEVRVLLAHFQLKSVTDIPVAYTINNGPPVFDTIGLLLPNSTVEFAFGTPADLSAEGTYQVMVYSDYWNDTDRSNDTIYQNIQSAICRSTWAGM